MSNPIAEKGLDTIIYWIQCVAPEAHYVLNVVGWSARDYERVYGVKLPATLLQNGGRVSDPYMGWRNGNYFKSQCISVSDSIPNRRQPLVLIEA